jgi:CRP-like cAMP-binding protein
MTSDVARKLEEFFSTYPKRSYPKGQIIIFGGENPENIFYITTGKVRIYDVSYRGEEIIVNIFKPPAFFPMTWAINKTDNKYFFKTEAPSEFNIVPTEDALDFVKNNPDVMLDLLSRLYHGVDGLTNRMVQLMSGNARSRLIYELIIEARRFGEVRGTTVHLDINESDLAARAGLSRETVSREIKTLKAEGLLSITRNSVEINNMKELAQKLGEDI